MHTRPSTRITALQLSLRAALAAGLAVAISEFLDLQYPLLALLAAVIVMDLSPSKTQRLALQRLAGTLLGATLGAILAAYLPGGPLATGFAIFAAMLVSHVVLVREATKLAGYVCGIVVLAHGEQPWSYALYRSIETLLGVAMAVLVSMVPKLLGVEIPDEGSDS